MPGFAFLTFSELSVALCALGMGSLALQLNHLPLDSGLLAFMALASFAFYSLERTLTLPLPENSIFPQKSQWIHSQGWIYWGLIFSSGSLALWLWCNLHFASQLSLILGGMIAASYSLIRIPWQGTRLHLKEVAILKPLILMLIWVLLTLLLPILEFSAWHSDLWLLSLIWALPLLANAVFFDIRDMELDHQENRQTLALVLGKKRAHGVVHGLLLTQIALILFLLPSAAPWIAGSVAFMLCNQYFFHRGTASLGFFILTDLTLALPALVFWLF